MSGPVRQHASSGDIGEPNPRAAESKAEERSSMVCPSCGTHNSNDFKFCPECGQRLVPAAAGPSAASAAAGSAPQPAARVDETAQAARLLDQAFQLYDDAEYDEALGCCQAALALDPGGSTAHSLLGMIYERLGKTAEAVQQYQIVLQMNPDSIADAIKLESLVSRKNGSGRRGLEALLRPEGRTPAVAGVLVAVAALIVGVWATSRAGGQGSNTIRRIGSRSSGGPIPGASMPRFPAATPAAPGAPESMVPPGTSFPVTPSAGTSPASPAGAKPTAAIPAPPPPNAWPAPQHAAYPPAPPLNRPQPGASMASAGRGGPSARRGIRSGYLAPAPIQGVERIDPRQPVSDVPGALMPGEGAAPQRQAGRGSAPVLPPVPTAGSERPTAQLPPPSTAAPPSASISIQPLDERESAGAARAAPPSAAPSRPPNLTEALRHQQMAAYYRRQGDDQAAYGEYQYARDLFLRIQQRGGRDAAVAAQFAVAAQHGMSRLQGP